MESSLNTTHFRKSTSSKIDYLYEIEYVSEDSKVPITQLPLLNPDKVFTKPKSTFPKVIKQVFGPSKHAARELILASQMEQHLVPATETKQMIPLRFNEGMVHQWKTHGYTHLHYGAIRLALTLHGRKDLPVVARVALLDTRYREYQHACIATIQTTLDAGTVFVTLYPNFNISLEDPQIFQNMQIQLQITGAPQVGNTYVATLHHQMVYRVQNHSMDLSLLQIPREELVKILPESWVTNYEKLHESSVPIQSVDSSIYKIKDGAIKISFKQQDGEKSRHPAFCTEINAISPAEEVQRLRQYLPGVPINKFNAARDPIYAFSDETGHKFFNVCDCDYCLISSSDEEEKPRRKKKKSSQQILKQRYEWGDPEVGLLGEPMGKEFEYYVLYSNGSTPPTSDNEDVRTCYMFGSSSSQEPTIFGSSSFLPTRIKEQRPAKKKHPTVPKETPKISAPENTKTTFPEKSEAQFTVEHAKNPISTFLEQVAEQTKPPKQ
ncbi:hypothetical protein EUTSA_v10001266mg [Eutrema salsugineum]|uniref:Uncharacterized protein n=1 Tax=Eutrema salsugineum TaxID=72664 RepID=V4KNP9_EUTSA|nr:hypothetical protein EUTSA_v10001266mg [Eutrema salsugineum]